MAKYIDKDALVAEIENYKYSVGEDGEHCGLVVGRHAGQRMASEHFLSFIDTIEVKEVDLEKFGEIARHLIAVKEHIEDMRLDKDEWSMLEKFGYPERFKAQKGEEL